MWKYLVKKFYLTNAMNQDIEEYLDKLGSESWELIQVIPSKSHADYFTFYFKRHISDNNSDLPI